MRQPIGRWSKLPQHQIGNWQGTFKYSLPAPCDNVMALVHAHRFEQAANVIVLMVYNYDKYVEIVFRMRRFNLWKIRTKRLVMRGQKGLLVDNTNYH